jgi:hypothetical protein
MSRQPTSDMYLELAQKALHISGEMNDMFNSFIKLFQRECEMMNEMMENRKIQIEGDNMPS